MNNVALRTDTEIKRLNITADLFERFIKYVDGSPKTVETYTKSLRQLIKYFAERGILEPTRDDIIAFRDDLKASGYKATTIQNYMAAAKILFGWLESEGIYPNITEHVKGAKVSRDHKKDYLTVTQVKEVLNEVERDTEKGLRDYAILTLMVTGGLRTIEVVQANIEDLGTAGGNVVLYIQGKGKQEKADYVKIAPEVEKAIRAYLKARGTTKEGEALFTSLSNNNRGSRLTTRSISGIIKQRLQAAGYDSSRLTAHSLRHTAVTLALLADKDITEVQQFARHANISTTMIYNHAVDRAKNSCSASIAAEIF